MPSPMPYRDEAGGEWTVTQSAEIGAGMMKPGEELPSATIATLIFRRHKDGIVRIGSVDTLKWHDIAAIERAYLASTEVPR